MMAVGVVAVVHQFHHHHTPQPLPIIVALSIWGVHSIRNLYMGWPVHKQCCHYTKILYMGSPLYKKSLCGVVST